MCLSQYPEFPTSPHYRGLLSSPLWASARKRGGCSISSLTRKTTHVLGRNRLISPGSWATDDLQVTLALWGDEKAVAWSESAPSFPGGPTSAWLRIGSQEVNAFREGRGPLCRDVVFINIFLGDLLQIRMESNCVCTVDCLYIKNCVKLHFGFVPSVGDMWGLWPRGVACISNETLLNRPPSASVVKSLPRKLTVTFAHLLVRLPRPCCWGSVNWESPSAWMGRSVRTAASNSRPCCGPVGQCRLMFTAVCTGLPAERSQIPQMYPLAYSGTLFQPGWILGTNF